MDCISNDPQTAVVQILKIANEKQIHYIQEKRKNGENWYRFDGGLILENYNKGRSKIGLLTTDGNINDYLKWSEPFGRTNKRFQNYIVGKSISELEDIFDIVKKFINGNILKEDPISDIKDVDLRNLGKTRQELLTIINTELTAKEKHDMYYY